mgnify:FL=1
MKKKYIAPKVEITFCYLEHSLLAGSDPSRKPEVLMPEGPKSPIEETGEDIDQGAKGFDAWSSWDE